MNSSESLVDALEMGDDGEDLGVPALMDSIGAVETTRAASWPEPMGPPPGARSIHYKEDSEDVGCNFFPTALESEPPKVVLLITSL